MQSAGKIVLVTGAQQGIGRAMAVEFAAAGADIAVNWLDDQDAAEHVANQVRGCGRRAILVKADVARIEQVRSMVSAAQEALGPIDVLVNNAGVFPRVPFLEMTENDWDYVLDVNLKGACFCAQSVAKGRALRGEQGRRPLDDPGDGAGAGAVPNQGQCDRPRPYRHRAATLWQQ